MSRTIIYPRNYQNKVILSLKLKLTQRNCNEKIIAIIKHFIDIVRKKVLLLCCMLFVYYEEMNWFGWKIDLYNYS